MLMKRILSMMSLALMLLAFGWAQQAQAKTVYLQPNDWTNDNARLALYAWGEGDGNDAWAEFTAVGTSGIYAATFDDATYSSGMIFVRMDPAQAMGWDAKWNQSGNLAVPAADNQLYSLSGWDGITVGSGVTVSDLFTYTIDFNSSITTTDPDFSVASNWGHIVDAYENYWGDEAYVSYQSMSDSGIDGSGCFRVYTNQKTNSTYDLLVTPLVSGLVTIYAKPVGKYYNDSAFLEIYSLNEDGTAKGSVLASSDFSSKSNSEEWDFTPITVYLSSEQRIGIRGSQVYMDNFMAQSATIVAQTEMKVTKVANSDGATGSQGTNPVFNQDENGNTTVTLQVTVENTGDTDLVAGETENYTLTLAQATSSSATSVSTYFEDAPFAIPVNIAAGESATFDAEFTVPATIPYSGYTYFFVRENIKGKTSSSYRYAQIKEYASKFIFDKAGSTYYSSPSATTTPIDFGKINEETTVSYEIYNSGSAPLTINSFTLPAPYTSDAPATPFEVAGGEKKVIAITLPYGEPGIFAGDLVINYTNFGKDAADYTLGISGTILDPSKNLIAFNNADNTNGQFPEGSIHSDQVYISYNSSADNYYLQSTSTTTKFITPLLTAAAGESFTYDAWYSSYSNSAAVTVYTSTDRVNWTQVDNQTYYSGIGSSAKTFTVTIPEAGNYYLAFELKSNALLDNIYGLTLAATPAHDWYLTEEADIPATGTQNNDYTATISLKNISAEADNLTATLYMDGEAVATQEVSLAGNDKTAAEGTGRTVNYSNIQDPTTIELTFKPHTPGTLPAYIELKAGDYVVNTDVVDVTISEEVATSDAIAVGNGGYASYSNAPIDFFNFEQVRTSDILYTAAQLEAFGIKAGDKIATLAFQGTCSSKSLTKSSLTAWVGFSTGDITYGTPDKDAMSEVIVYKPGDMVFTSGTQWVNINLPEPVVYDGTSDLRIYLEGGGNGEYISFSFAGDSNYPNMKWSNSTSMKANPVLYVTLVTETPKLFGMVHDISDMDKNVAGAKVTIRSSENDVEYSGVTDAEGNYCIDIIQKDLVYDELFCELEGYADESYTERYEKTVSFNEEDPLWQSNYPFYDEAISGCVWNPLMYPCVEVTISESTYATFYYADQAYEIPEGVTAYAAIKNESDITLDEVPVYINAGCPVVLNGEPGTYQFKWTDITTPYTRPNDLIGSEEGGTFGNDGAKYYVLSWKNKNKNIDEVGFYFLSGSKGKYAKVKAHQAYMRVEASQANEAGYSFVFDAGTTGISTVEADGMELDLNQPMYNLAGQRVGKDYRGVVLQNGKKIIKK